ncbi:MAG: hypothetical protein IKK21_06665, partial [Clostridia bacterium]|nr:hypothetical protein [Clostridia bacterium]
MRYITTHALRKVAAPSPVWQIIAPVEAWSMAPGRWRDVPGLEDHAGTVVYEKKVTCAGTLRFVFGGAADTCRAWLDDLLLCEHTGAGAFDAVARDVDWGEHILRLEVDCDRPGCGGLTGEVTIEQMGSAYITALKVETAADGAARVTVRVRSLSSKMQVADVEVSVAGAAVEWKKRLLPSGKEITLRGEVRCDARPWSAADPALYPAEAVLWLEGEPADDLRDRVGFRNAGDAAAFVDFPVPDQQDALRMVQLAKQADCPGLKMAAAPDWLLD